MMSIVRGWLLRIGMLAVALAPALPASAAGADGSVSAPHAAPALEQASAPVRAVLTHAGRERAYYLWTPPRTPGVRVPLVLVLHGGGGNGENAQRMTGFTGVARREGFAVAYPEGTGRFGRLLTWNAGHCCGYAMTERVDDVGFLTALIERLVAEGIADPARVYVTGMSNGAMMAHRMGIEASAHVAAIAPVVGGLFGDEGAPVTPVSALLVNGWLDRSVPAAGGLTGGRFANAWDGTPLRPAAYQGDYWAAANGCRDAGTEVQRGTVRERDADCAPGIAVRSLMLLDNGHAWPGGKPGSSLGDPPSTALDATEVVWAFFAAHPKAAHPGTAAAQQAGSQAPKAVRSEGP